METITNSNIKDFAVNGKWSIAGSMRPFKGADDSKTFTLNVSFNNVLVQDIITKALDPTKIQWVNGPGRTNYDKWTDKQTVNIDFKSPGKAPVVDAKTQMIMDAKNDGIDIQDKAAFSDWLKERFNI